MKIVKFLLSLAAMLGLVWLLNTPLNVKGLPIPALGYFLSPFDGFWKNGIPAKETPTDELFSNLSSDVKVVYDDRMVPHIFAQNLSDAYYVQGYIHATNRLWQMDFITRASGGRLSEVLGNRILRGSLTTVDVDKLNRRRGIARGAEATVEEWKKDTETWELIMSYCNGVNQYIRTLDPKSYPIEYKFFGVTPEEWTPLRMALFAKYMAMDLALGEDDLRITNAKKLLGNDFDALFPQYFKEQEPIVPKGTKWNNGNNNMSDATKEPHADAIIDELISFISYEDVKPDENNGSNNWAVAASKTKNKKPILCGDPHLGLRLPSIWYEIQISTPDMNVYGVSLPGLPAVLIGFNDHIAWTQTNVGHDVADWYTIKWKDNNKMEYVLDGVAKKADLRIEEIKVKDMPSVFDTVKYTHWGPVVYENDTMPQANMAFHWLANLVPESSIKTFVKLNKAKNYDEYSDAIKEFNVPAQNYAFACKDGDIALKVMGIFPKKAQGQGRFLQDGSSSANGWKGYIPKEQNPQYRNPSRGFISSANQHSTDPSYPYYYFSENFEPYRGRIINKMLASSDTFTVEDMMKMQNNNYSLMAEEALPNMMKHLDSAALNETEKALLNALKGWNYYYDADKIEPIYFEQWFSSFHIELWDEIFTQPKSNLIAKPTTWRTVFLLRDDAKSKYFDRKETVDKKEGAKDILTESFKKMAAKIVELQAANAIKYPESPLLTWSKYKETEIQHISQIPGMGRKNIMNGGYGKAINALKKDHGPSWRMIVELGDTPKAYVVYPGGQSGNPGSPYYDNFIEKWTKGEYYEALFLKNADEKNDRILTVQSFKKG